MAQTLAELLVKVKSDGAKDVKRDLRDIENQLKRIETQAQKSMRAFNSQQSRLLRGQAGMMSGSANNPMAGTASALREITRELERLNKPLNATLDGLTQIGQILTNRNVSQALSGGAASRNMITKKPMAFSLRNWLLSEAAGGVQNNNPTKRQIFGTKVMNFGVGFGNAMGEGGFQPLAGSMQHATTAALGLAGALTAATSAAIQYATKASQQAVERESLMARISGLNKQGSTTGQIASLAREVALPSKFTTRQMEEMSAQVLSYGLNVERVLPLIGKLGNAFGAGPEQLAMYSNAFGQFAGGQMPDVQVLNQMGITKAMLKQGGVKFDGTTLISSTEKVMVVMEQIINSKYKRVTELMNKTTESARANIQDSMDMITYSFGEALNKGLLPFESALSKVLQGIENSKFPMTIANDLLAPMTAFTGTVNDLTDAIKQLIAYTAAFATSVPRQLAAAVKEWNGVSTQQNVLGGLQRVGSRSMTIFRFLGGLFDPTGSGLGATATIPEVAKKYLDSMSQQVKKQGTSNKKRLLDPFGGILPFGDGSGSDKNKKSSTKNTLEKIEANTRKSAELLDLRRQTIGGGEIAGLGVTGAEIAGMGLRNRSEITLRSPIRPDTEIVRGIKNLMGGNMNFALQGSPLNRVRY